MKYIKNILYECGMLTNQHMARYPQNNMEEPY